MKKIKLLRNKNIGNVHYKAGAVVEVEAFLAKHLIDVKEAQAVRTASKVTRPKNTASASADTNVEKSGDAPNDLKNK